MDENERPKAPRKRAPAARDTEATPSKPRARRAPAKAEAAATPVRTVGAAKAEGATVPPARRARKPAAKVPDAPARNTAAPTSPGPPVAAPAPPHAGEADTPSPTSAAPARKPVPRPRPATPAAAPPPQDTSARTGPPPATARPAASQPVTRAPSAPSAPSAARTAKQLPAASPLPAAKRSASGDDAAPIPSFARKPAPPPPRPASTAHPADASTRSTRAIDWLLGYLPAPHRARIREYLVLMRMDRPVGALLLLWPTWWALWFAAGDFPPPGALVIFTLGVFVMRSAGCVINDYADHGWLDANVERTRGRPMAAGRVSKREALLLFGGLLAFAFLLVLFTNALTIKLAFVGAALAAVYPFTKRVTHLAQVVLGAAFGWSIPMAFAAVTGTLPPLCWLLFLANVLFSVIYDTEYAMVDREDDLRVGAKSTAILFADADRAIIGVLMGTFLLAMLLAGTRAALHWPWFIGLAIAAGLFGWQQWLIRARDRDACFAAFRNNNWVGFVLWIGLVLALAIR